MDYMKRLFHLLHGTTHIQACERIIVLEWLNDKLVHEKDQMRKMRDNPKHQYKEYTVERPNFGNIR